ncbi:hypothetical protein SK128_004899 [Halocaridina rubra]|uniref:Uncharacterized protein n=1 Tax=Halocaridina rubra TaxID=373956 RepID=A0AAN8X6P5_HALRR
MKLFIILALVVAVLSAPQSLNIQDAEVVPGGIPRDSSPDGGSSAPDGTGIRVFRIPFPRFSILDLFGDDEIDTPQTRGNDTRTPDNFFTRFFGGNGFPFNTPDDSFFRVPTLFPRFPIFPSRVPIPDFPSFDIFPNITSFGDIPDGFTNSTHEVKVVNGSRVEMNKTITRTNDNGIVFTKVIFSVSPERNESSVADIPQVPPQVTTEGKEIFESSTLPDEDPRINQVQTEPYEDFGNSTKGLSRHKRWVNDNLKSAHALLSRSLVHSPLPISFVAPASTEDSHEDFESAASSRMRPIPTPLPNPPVTAGRSVINLEGDTDVNYRGPLPREENPDAEVFDVDLVREDAERYFERLPSSSSRFRPLPSNLVRSLPVRRQPVRYPVRRQPVWYQPFRHGW